MQRKSPHQKLSQTIGCRCENLVEAFAYKACQASWTSKGVLILAASGMLDSKLGYFMLHGLLPP